MPDHVLWLAATGWVQESPEWERRYGYLFTDAPIVGDGVSD